MQFLPIFGLILLAVVALSVLLTGVEYKQEKEVSPVLVLALVAAVVTIYFVL